MVMLGSAWPARACASGRLLPVIQIASRDFEQNYDLSRISIMYLASILERWQACRTKVFGNALDMLRMSPGGGEKLPPGHFYFNLV